MHYRATSGRPAGETKNNREGRLLERGLLTVSLFARTYAYLDEATVRRYLEAGEDSYPPEWRAWGVVATKPDSRFWVIKLKHPERASLSTVPLTEDERRLYAQLTDRLSQAMQG